MFVRLPQLDNRWIKCGYLLLTFTLVLLMVRISRIRLTVSYMPFSSPPFSSPSLNRYAASDLRNGDFSFPEVNETAVLQNQVLDVGQMKSLYFLQEFEPLDNYSDNQYTPFQPGLSREERQILLMLFQKFVIACYDLNVTFILYGGSLLGSFRHFDIIPWDDDIDVLLNSSHKDLLKQAVSLIDNNFQLYSPENMQWKFYWTKPQTLPHKPFRWPYIDIFFFEENETHVFDELPGFRHAFSYPKSEVFPLMPRLFAGALLPAPCNIGNVIKKNYSPSLCKSPSFSHKLETSMPGHLQTTIPCKRLHSLYPFVFRRTLGNTVYDVLSVDNRIIRTVIAPKECG